ncbi:hypothetical protein FKM82_030888 [Ascaphus truei]
MCIFQTEGVYVALGKFTSNLGDSPQHLFFVFRMFQEYILCNRCCLTLLCPLLPHPLIGVFRNRVFSQRT